MRSFLAIIPVINITITTWKDNEEPSVKSDSGSSSNALPISGPQTTRAPTMRAPTTGVPTSGIKCEPNLIILICTSLC